MILLAAVAIGISLVVVAMGLNIYSSFKQGDVGRALFGSSGCAGLVFYCSIIFGVAGQLVLGLQVFSLAYILCLIVLPYLLIFFGEPLGLLIAGEKTGSPKAGADIFLSMLSSQSNFCLSMLRTR